MLCRAPLQANAVGVQLDDGAPAKYALQLSRRKLNAVILEEMGCFDPEGDNDPKDFGDLEFMEVLCNLPGCVCKFSAPDIHMIVKLVTHARKSGYKEESRKGSPRRHHACGPRGAPGEGGTQHKRQEAIVQASTAA